MQLSLGDFNWIELGTSFEDFIHYWSVYAKKLTQDEASGLFDNVFMAFYIVRTLAPSYLQPSNPIFPYYGHPRDPNYWLRLFFAGRERNWPAKLMDDIIPRARHYLEECPLLYTSLNKLLDGKLQHLLQVSSADHTRWTTTGVRQLREARVARAIYLLYGGDPGDLL